EEEDFFWIKRTVCHEKTQHSANMRGIFYEIRMWRVLQQNLLLTLILPLSSPPRKQPTRSYSTFWYSAAGLLELASARKTTPTRQPPTLTATALVQPKATARRGVMADEKMPPKLPPVLKIPAA